MTSQVFYRKWRPQTLTDVVGQEPITSTLRNALITDRLAHAYLFFGPRGTGKTSTGRILAKAINCLQRSVSGEPCNTCAVCRSFIEGRAMDLIEIDAASNTGVDDIRSLKEKINFAPNVARYKVYIIDEVHMLSNSAFNALLKTLEEPPAHVVFILATTEVHKVPPTITSRCQRFDFRRIPQAAMIERLQQVCREEGIDADPQSLALIARSATGSLRDAENLLERMVVYHGPRIEIGQVRAELGLTGDARVKELAESILHREITRGLSLLNSIASDGLDLHHFNQELVEYLRHMLLIKAGAGESLQLATEELSEIRQLAFSVPLQSITQAIKLFSLADFRYSSQSTLPLELALVDYALSHQPQSTTLPQEPETISEIPKSSGAIDPPQTIEEMAPVAAKAAAPVAKRDSPPDIAYVQQHWDDFVTACRGEGTKGNLDALLRRACKPVSLEGSTLSLGFYAEFNRSKIDDPKYGQIVQRKLKDVFGTAYDIRCILIGKETRPSPPSAKEGPLVRHALSHGAKIISEE